MPQEVFQKVKGIIQFINWSSLHSNGPSQINSMSICMVLNSRSLQTTTLQTYVLTTAKLDATGHRWVAALSNYTFGITYKPGKGHVDADALSHIRWPEAIDIDTQTVHAVCNGVRPHMAKWKPFARGPKQWMHCVKTMPHQAMNHCSGARLKPRTRPFITLLTVCKIKH